MISSKEYLSFDDVLIQPHRGKLDHRVEASLTTRLGELFLPLPILSSPMTSVTDGAMASAMFHAGGRGVIHRFMTVEEQVHHYHRSEYSALCAVGLDDYERVRALMFEGCTDFVLDVAHAHTDRVLHFVDKLNDTLPTADIFVGSVASRDAIHDFSPFPNVRGFRVGIGPGAACTTRETTGAGVPQLTAIMDAAEVAEQYGKYIIADGGIRNSGDIVKAIVAGADVVMLGYLLAGANEAPSPGQYWGMASEEQRVRNGTEYRAPEGVSGMVMPTGSVTATLSSLADGIRSGISYAGGRSLDDIRGRTNLLIRVTNSTREESGARI